MKKAKSLLRNDKGQSTIEFALTMILLIAFILFYFQLSMTFAFGNFVHYATFMSARAFLAAGPTYEDQKERARSVIVRMVKRGEGQAGTDRFPSLARGVGEGDPRGVQMDPPAQFNIDDSDFSWMQGVRYTFRSKLILIPFAGTGRAGKPEATGNSPQKPGNSVTLTSESWLGREPDDDECRALLGKGGWAFDNGC